MTNSGSYHIAAKLCQAGCHMLPTLCQLAYQSEYRGGLLFLSLLLPPSPPSFLPSPFPLSHFLSQVSQSTNGGLRAYPMLHMGITSLLLYYRF